MVRLTGGNYVSNINGHIIHLLYLGKNQCQLYIDHCYQGIHRFDLVKNEINRFEQRHTVGIHHRQFRE